jgi:hydrogenase expression/formation protein HypE
MHKTILMSHGSGGLMTGELIKDYFVRHFNNPFLNKLTDSSVVQAGDTLLAFTTDSYVVDPVFFPGGNIGKLAVCGTVNDLTTSGAKPLYLSAGFIIEEGFMLSDLETITKSMAEEARYAGVEIITGDTKVVRKGQCDKIFINTAGIGIVEKRHSDIAGGLNVEPGDRLLVNGYLGDHEMAILSARENLRFEEPAVSDAASLNHMVHRLLDGGINIKYLRDITRGGLGTILSEMVQNRNFGLIINEEDLPVREHTKGLCELYGFDPLYLANEGKMLMVVSASTAEKALDILKHDRDGENATIIGSVTSDNRNTVLMRTVTGGINIVQKLAGEQLPRIC